MVFITENKIILKHVVQCHNFHVCVCVCVCVCICNLHNSVSSIQQIIINLIRISKP
jgi:hypothetical protein